MGPRPPRLAYRMQRDGDHVTWRTDRYSLRWRGQYFPTSRSGDRAERRRHRKKICALLAALRAFAGRWPEDVEIARKFLYAVEPFGKGIHRPGNSLRADARALSRAAELHVGRTGGRAASARPHRRVAGATARSGRKKNRQRKKQDATPGAI